MIIRKEVKVEAIKKHIKEKFEKYPNKKYINNFEFNEEWFWMINDKYYIFIKNEVIECYRDLYYDMKEWINNIQIWDEMRVDCFWEKKSVIINKINIKKDKVSISSIGYLDSFDNQCKIEPFKIASRHILFSGVKILDIKTLRERIIRWSWSKYDQKQYEDITF